MRHLLLSVHLLCAVAWVGGMFFAYFCLRPAAAEVLAPPQRLPLMAASFDRFLRYMAVAVLLILASGWGLLQPVGLAAAPLGWHLMLGGGLVMSAVFAIIFFRGFPLLKARCSAQDWPAAAQALQRIRQLVAVNLSLGVAVVIAAATAR